MGCSRKYWPLGLCMISVHLIFGGYQHGTLILELPINLEPDSFWKPQSIKNSSRSSQALGCSVVFSIPRSSSALSPASFPLPLPTARLACTLTHSRFRVLGSWCRASPLFWLSAASYGSIKKSLRMRFAKVPSAQ